MAQWNLSAGAAILFQLLIDQLGMSHEEIAASSLHLLGVIVRPLVGTMAELAHVQAEKARVILLLRTVPSSFHAESVDRLHDGSKPSTRPARLIHRYGTAYTARVHSVSCHRTVGFTYCTRREGVLSGGCACRLL